MGCTKTRNYNGDYMYIQDFAATVRFHGLLCLGDCHSQTLNPKPLNPKPYKLEALNPKPYKP